MVRFANVPSPVLLSALSLSLLVACDAGSVGGDDNGGIDPPDDEMLVCMAELSLTGTLSPSGEPPGPDDGCVPYGTWTLNVTLVDQGDCDSVPFESQYVYAVSQDPDNGAFVVSFPNDPDSDFIDLTMSGEGGGCSGTFTHYSADGTEVLRLKPFSEGTTLTGYATYEVYLDSQL